MGHRVDLGGGVAVEGRVPRARLPYGGRMQGPRHAVPPEELGPEAVADHGRRHGRVEHRLHSQGLQIWPPEGARLCQGRSA